VTALLIAGLVIYTLASAFFSASETALFSLTPMQVRSYRRQPDRRRRLIAELLATPRGLLFTVLMMNVLVNLLVQNTASSLFNSFPGWILKVGFPLVLTLLFGEIIPKSIALPNNERIAYAVAPTISFVYRVLAPVRRAVTHVASYLSRFMFFFLHREREISHEELQHALDLSEQHGVLSREEAELVSGFMRIHTVAVRDLMWPRADILFYDINLPLSKLLHLFVEEEVSRVPVCDHHVENILGVMEADTYFLHRDQIHETGDLKRFLKKPFYVPETMEARDLLRRFGDREEALAIVVDEYGSISGLIAREDLVEVIVGEIVDRRDVAALYTRASRDVVIASGKLELEEFNTLFDEPLPIAPGCVTLGGWLTQRLGRIPIAGEKVVTEHYLFHVLAAEPNRVRRLYVRRINGEEVAS
jgi:magnesium and cobalt exporter, CNNM family